MRRVRVSHADRLKRVSAAGDDQSGVEDDRQAFEYRTEVAPIGDSSDREIHHGADEKLACRKNERIDFMDDELNR